jgi:hypothetical protein
MIPSYEFELDGEKYFLRFSARTLINIEKALKRPISSIENILPSEISVELLSVFFSSGIKKIDGTPLKPKELDDLLDNISANDLSTIVNKGFEIAYPQQKEGDTGN